MGTLSGSPPIAPVPTTTPIPGPTAEPTPLPSWFPLRWQLDAAETRGLCGSTPLPWWSAGWFEGDLRQLALALRRAPDAGHAELHLAIKALVAAFAATPAAEPWQHALLVPVPSGRKAGNPVPALIAGALAEQLDLALAPELLQRHHGVITQHRLSRQQRWRCQWHSFSAPYLAADPATSARPLLLIDDVLTSGATLLAAQRSLRRAGWPVIGALCLARTPWRRKRRPGVI